MTPKRKMCVAYVARYSHLLLVAPNVNVMLYLFVTKLIRYIARSLLTSDNTKSSVCICADALCLMSASHDSRDENAFWYGERKV